MHFAITHIFALLLYFIHLFNIIFVRNFANLCSINSILENYHQFGKMSGIMWNFYIYDWKRSAVRSSVPNQRMRACNLQLAWWTRQPCGWRGFVLKYYLSLEKINSEACTSKNTAVAFYWSLVTVSNCFAKLLHTFKSSFVVICRRKSETWPFAFFSELTSL